MICKINKEECLQCDACKDECPVDAIKVDDNGDYYIDQELCNSAGGFENCGLCLEVCAVDAISPIEFKAV